MAGGSGRERARPNASAAPKPRRASVKSQDLFLDSLWLPDSSTVFNGSNSMSDFEAELGVAKSGQLLHTGEAGECEEDLELDACFPLQGKKRRLSAHQVQFLERSFEVENRLEPDRKAQLAKDLGLHPRQVAIWFQNRRARFKTKRIEKDYDSLKASYDSLKANYDSLLKENDELKLQVDSLKHKLHQTEKFKDNAMTSAKSFHPWLGQSHHQESVASEAPKLQEDSTSAKSDVLDYESPRLTGYSSQGLEPESSEIEDGNSPTKIGMEFPAPLSYFPKIEDEDYPSCTFGFSSSPSSEDHPFWNWAY